MRYWLFVTLGLFLVMGAHWAQAADTTVDNLPKDKTCVGYKTTKEMFFIANVDVVGINCSLTMERPEQGMIRVTIPVDKFDSGVTGRDEHVAQILGGENMMPILFESPIPGAGEYSGDSIVAQGALIIQGRRYPLEVSFVKESDKTFTFEVTTKLSLLEVIVPKVGFGVIAIPSDDIVLYGRVYPSHVNQ
ncbi:MAG: hypothetical protein OEZ32_05760 [Nitrospinota bacterium]|nr:hypothetical protein [Nitrospinota bacterium]